MAGGPQRTLEFAGYAFIGAARMLVHYAVLTTLVAVAQMDQVLASTQATVFGAAFCNYLINHRVTFMITAPHRDAMPRFLAVAALRLCINAVELQVGVSVLKLHYLWHRCWRPLSCSSLAARRIASGPSARRSRCRAKNADFELRPAS